MKNHDVNQFQPEVKVYVFESTQEPDAWVKAHYYVLGARYCPAVEAKQLAKPDKIIEH